MARVTLINCVNYFFNETIIIIINNMINSHVSRIIIMIHKNMIPGLLQLKVILRMENQLKRGVQPLLGVPVINVILRSTNIAYMILHLRLYI